MDRAFQRIRSLMLRGTFYSVPPIMHKYRKIGEKKYDNWGNIPEFISFIWKMLE